MVALHCKDIGMDFLFAAVFFVVMALVTYLVKTVYVLHFLDRTLGRMVKREI